MTGPPAERFNAAAFFVDRHLAEGRGERPVFRYRGQRVTYKALAEQQYLANQRPYSPAALISDGGR